MRWPGWAAPAVLFCEFRFGSQDVRCTRWGVQVAGEIAIREHSYVLVVTKLLRFVFTRALDFGEMIMMAEFVFALLAAFLCVDSAGNDGNWPQFRGHLALGLGSGSPPVEWDIETGKNIGWKTPIPGLGHASPIVWGQRVFVATAVSKKADPELKTGWLGGSGKSPEDDGDWTWQLLCLDLDSGKQLWSRDARDGSPIVKRHLKASHANCTPATDGTHVVTFFGSEGLYCYDFEGELLWEHDFGRLHAGPYDSKEMEWGFASSPIIHDGCVIVQCDCLNTNFVAILDVKTGEEIRRIERKGEVATWSTPAVLTHDGKTQVVCNGYKKMSGYDFETGQQLWYLSGGGDIPVPTPLYSGGRIFITNGHAGSPTFAIMPDAMGDLTPKNNKEPVQGLSWWQKTDGSYMPTPLVLDGLIYTCNDNGRLAVRQADSGKLVYRQRVGTGSRVYSASAVAADGKLYFCSERGEVTVVRQGRKFERVAKNEMQDIVMATPAIAGDRLLIRTVSELICIEAENRSDEASP